VDAVWREQMSFNESSGNQVFWGEIAPFKHWTRMNTQAARSKKVNFSKALQACANVPKSLSIRARIAHPERTEIFLDPKTKERWMEICDQASKEQDPKKLMELIAEIDHILKEKRDRVNQRRAEAAD
jgi:predicted Zn-dependent protease